MNRLTATIIPLLLATSSAFAQGYATKIRAEVQTAGEQSLRSLEWQQGSTPLIRVEPLDNGRPIAAETNMTVRMIIGESATAELYAVANASAGKGNYYEIQWPTIGTNTVDSAWWYTIYFEKDGRRYWTGNGELNILATTSTADGMVWQEITSGAEVDPIAQPVATNALAQAQAASSTADASFITATNALAIAQAALTAEVDPIAYPVATNALARLKQLEQYGDADIVPSPDNWFEFSGGTITGFNYVAGRKHVVIPYEIGGVPVLSIWAFAFSDVDTGEGKPVVSVIAPKTVTTIDPSAFFRCMQLTSVSFPSADSIGDNAFSFGTALTTVNFPSATSIGNFVFEGCTALASITLGKTPPTTWDAGTVATATIYVPFDAVGYSDTFEGMPVIRATESADNYYLGGKTLENRFDEKANAETIYTGAVCPASEGTRYYWASGTNVALSVGTISNGGTVNIAKLNNTATNSITAIGKAGWVWTGGEMTNTITAGKSMTFGFLVDPSNGKTNAYATGVSK